MKHGKIKILFAGYRDWALNTSCNCWIKIPDIDITLVKTQNELISFLEKFNYDFVFLAGWSWVIPKEFCNKHKIYAFHPSNLPDYSGGSPIQHQILDGIEETYASVFRVTSNLDEGGIICKERISLSGNMTDIFKELETVSFNMIQKIISMYPDITEIPQDTNGIVKRKRLKPEDSNLKDLSKYTTKELYDQIRCRMDPYPNAYIEDEFGRLEFKDVIYTPKQ